MPADRSLGSLLVDGEASAGEAAVDYVRSVLDLLEPALDGLGDLGEVGRGEVADLSLDQRPDTCSVAGKTPHHGHGLNRAGKKVFDKQLPNTEPKLRDVFEKLKSKFGTVLVLVDQPTSIGALPLTVARDTGCKVAYLPGLSMRRIADLYPGEVKTDAKDAAVIADAARTMPHTLRSLELTDELSAELTVLVGFDQDLAADDLAAGTLRISGRAAEGRTPQLLRPMPSAQEDPHSGATTKDAYPCARRSPTEVRSRFRAPPTPTPWSRRRASVSAAASGAVDVAAPTA